MFILSSTRLRFKVLWLSRQLGRTTLLFTTGWTPPVFLLVIVSLCLWLAEELAIRFHLFNVKSGTWFQVSNILVLFLLISFLLYIWRARKWIVVEEFVDYLNASPEPITKGLATLLIIKLAQLRELYQEVDERRANPTEAGVDRSQDATINVEDVGGILKGAVSPESKMSLGPLVLPVGNLVSLISRVVQSSRIISSIHIEKKAGEDIIILTAQKVGGLQSYNWRVERTITGLIEKGKYDFDDMIMELAHRIFADMQLRRTVRWKSLLAFTEGLQIYRDCLRSPKDKKLKLKEARRKFLETLAEDTDFDLAYYNLGVVYSELDQEEAAEITFLEATHQNPHVWRAYYALAANRFERGRNDSVLSLCERVIDLRPGSADLAKVYHLKGLAQRRSGDLHGAIKSHKRAVCYVWKALCRTQFLQQKLIREKISVLPRIEEIASKCLAEIAVAHGYLAVEYELLASKSKFMERWRAKTRRAQVLRVAKISFQQAFSLYRYDATYYFELGKLYYEWGKYDQAVYEYESALQVYPEKAMFSAYLALAQSKCGKIEAALFACKKALDDAFYNPDSFEDKDALEKTAEVYRRLGEISQSDRVEKINEFLEELEKDVERGKDALPSLRRKLWLCNHDLWRYGRVSYVLGRIYLTADKPKLAEKRFRKAIENLEDSHPTEIKSLELRALLVRSLLNQENFDAALQEADLALSLDPLNPFVRDVLGDGYFELKEYQRAMDVWLEALLQQPDNTNIHLKIGVAYYYYTQDSRDIRQRNTAYQQATKFLRQALDLYEVNQLAQKGLIYYFLGSLHVAWGVYEEAISCFRISQALGFSPLTSRFFLGYAYLRNKYYDVCAEYFQSIIEELETLRDANDFIDENKTEEEWSLNEILVMAYWGMAFSYTERNVKLKEALRLIEIALKLMNKLGKNKVADFHYPASCWDCKGWILTKLGETNKAIDCLEQALSLETGAETYLHLAIAYAHKLQDTTSDSQKRQLAVKVGIYCQHVRELDINGEFIDINGEFKRPVKELLQLLGVNNQSEPQDNALEQNQMPFASNENPIAVSATSTKQPTN